MPTQTERKSAQAKLAAFGKALAKTDFDGDVYDAYKVGTFIDENPDIFEPGTKELYLKNIKALTAEISPDGTQCLVSMDSGEASMDEDPDAVPPEEAKRLKIRLDKQDRKLEELSEKMRRDTQLRSAPLGIKTRVPGQSHWEHRKSKGINVFSSADAAHEFGLHLLANSGVVQKLRPDRAADARKSLDSMGRKAQANSPLSAGGATVPDQFVADIINEVEEYGVARQLLNVVPMTSNRTVYPRSTGGLTVYFPEEGGSLTASDNSWDNVTLTAHKAIVLNKMNNEHLDDTAVALAEFIAGEMARAIAQKEDDILFNGTGTSAFGNMLGLASSFTAEANNARSVIGGDTTSAHTLANLYTVMSKLNTRHLANAVWTCTPTVKALTFDRLAGSVGGLTMVEIAGKPYQTFLGFPIITNQSMNFSNDVSGNIVDVYFGDFGRLGMFGDRKSLDIEISTEAFWGNDQTAMRGIERFDINLHELGNGTTAGAVVALWQT